MKPTLKTITELELDDLEEEQDTDNKEYFEINQIPIEYDWDYRRGE